jgi:hypothetical protein
MKRIVTKYVFDSSTGNITFSEYRDIELERILLITNVTSNVIIYNFANPTLGGSVNNNVLTLNFDTSAMSNTDLLQIYYFDEVNPVSYELVEDLRILIHALSFLNSARGVSGELRVTPLSTPNMGTLTTLNNLTTLSLYPTTTLVKNSDNNIFVLSNLNNLSTTP